MIRVLLVSSHPPLRAGLAHVLEREPGLRAELADSVPVAHEQIAQVRPGLVLLDTPLEDDDAFEACHAMKQLTPAPRVAIYAHSLHKEVRLAAWVAGADALLSKTEPAETLFEQLRLIAGGRRILPPLDADEISRVQFPGSLEAPRPATPGIRRPGPSRGRAQAGAG